MNKRDEKRLNKLWHYLHFDVYLGAVDAERIIGMLIQQQYNHNDKIDEEIQEWESIFGVSKKDFEKSLLKALKESGTPMFKLKEDCTHVTDARGMWVDDKVQV